MALSVSGSCLNGQVEIGSNASSYIPTVAASVTRNTDVISKTGISDLINSPTGSFFIEASSALNGGSFRIFSISDGTSNNRISIAFSSISNRLLVFYILSSGIKVNQEVINFNQLINHKILYTWGEGLFKAYVDGVNVVNLTGITMPTADLFNKVSFDIGNGGNNFHGNVKSLQLYKTALTDAESITLTTL